MPSILRITWLGLLAATGTMVCIATLAGFAGQLWWGFELASHFRVQYAVALGFGALILPVWRRVRWAVTFAAFALLNAILLAPRFPSWTEAQASGDGPVFRALLANVNSANRDHERIRDAILAHQPDFVVLLETTPWLLDRLTDLTDRYPYRTVAPREDNFGIAFFSRRPFSRADIAQFGAAGLPSIIAEFAIDRHRLIVLGTHPLPPVGAGPARERNDQLAQLAAFARQTPLPLLLLGDLNTSPWSPYFEKLLADSGLRDSGGGRGILPSWPVGWPPLWIPIDHALFSEGIRIRRVVVGPDLGSDHYPVIVDFQVAGP
ncbi:MAG TPA: endonuclease/exonuclease/phosphatase family protein [Candidatus Competibacter sp.]|nr:endonuclease/exonuclease/phosphatase family protein [Candidatus Competibacter sp.]